MRRNRKNTIWLGILSILMMLVVISPNVSSAVQALLIGTFLLALGGVVLDANLSNRLLQGIGERVSTRQNRISSEAREAQERAQQRGSYFTDDIELIDIGVISTQSGSDGVVMRRTRTVSKDDDGVRPFVILQVPPEDAERNVTIRFEFIDHRGEQQYVHQVNPYLRDGEMNILADTHLPLWGNDKIVGIGDWDLRVYINNNLVGLHSFHCTASQSDRQQQTAERVEERRRRLTDTRRETPVSLEDLLRGQDDNQQGNR
jgi:uncharacterized integral membrane protein